jgi:hypothetical protein
VIHKSPLLDPVLERLQNTAVCARAGPAAGKSKQDNTDMKVVAKKGRRRTFFRIDFFPRLARVADNTQQKREIPMIPAGKTDKVLLNMTMLGCPAHKDIHRNYVDINEMPV